MSPRHAATRRRRPGRGRDPRRRPYDPRARADRRREGGRCVDARAATRGAPAGQGRRGKRTRCAKFVGQNFSGVDGRGAASLELLSMVVHDSDVRRPSCALGPLEAMRHRGLTRMLYCPARSPFRASKRLPGRPGKSSRLAAASRIQLGAMNGLDARVAAVDEGSLERVSSIRYRPLNGASQSDCGDCSRRGGQGHSRVASYRNDGLSGRCLRETLTGIERVPSGRANTNDNACAPSGRASSVANRPGRCRYGVR